MNLIVTAITNWVWLVAALTLLACLYLIWFEFRCRARSARAIRRERDACRAEYDAWRERHPGLRIDRTEQDD